jgi:hypothetical protein
MWTRILLSLLSPYALCCLIVAGCGGTPSSPDTGSPTTGAGTITVGHYVIAADGLSVTDVNTGLAWQRDTLGLRTGCGGGLTCTWVEAQSYCAGLTVGSLTGWRLPTLSELLSLVDKTVTPPPLIDQTAFPNTQANTFWTSSPEAGSTECAMIVSFYNGLSYDDGETFGNGVRCVR